MQIIDAHSPKQPDPALPPAAPPAAPAANDPMTIARDPSLSRRAKIDCLRRLEFDVRQALVAREEGMSGISTLPTLAEVLAAIAHVDPKGTGPTTPSKF